MKILVIEDDPTFSNLLKETLKQWGHDVEAAADALTGTQTAVRLQPQVILLDLVMPAGDGLQVVERLKANTRTYEIPIVMITSYGDREEIQKAYKMGIHAAFAKPIVFEELKQTLEQLAQSSS